MIARPLITISFLAAGLWAQDTPQRPERSQPAEVIQPRAEQLRAEQPKGGQYTLTEGTRLPLSLINSVSTKHSAEGDRVYLETAFPLLVNGRIVVPVGSYVAGTVTQIKRPGRVKGRGELFVRFDSLTLPNGVTRDFHGRIGQTDGTARNELDRAEGKVRSEGNKAGDARTIGEATAAGASIGVLAGSAASHAGMGAGIGAAAGAAAGMVGVLFTRGPDAVLTRGSTLEMILDRPVSFEESEIDFAGIQTPRRAGAVSGDSGADGKSVSPTVPRSRWPF